MNNMTFIRFTPVTRTETLCTRCASPAVCTPRQVHSRMTYDSDVCDVDPGMQINFLNAALCELCSALSYS